jgi:polar amino acid transport system ATP-binding protein
VSATPVLQLRGVTKYYGEREVLGGVDLTVYEGCAVAVIGSSGSGKSTLLRCIDLLEEIDDGDIYLDGVPVTDPGTNPVPVRRRLGLVFQAYNLFPHKSVIENVVLGAVLGQRVRHGDALAGAHALLERFGLAGRERDYPDRLSGGQQQRVAIVRALMTRPRALLLDEVTSPLDPELVGEVLEIIAELKNDGMTMLIATHEMGFARAIADEVCYLEAGRIVERGPPERIFSNPQEPSTRRFLARLLEAERP